MSSTPRLKRLLNINLLQVIELVFRWFGKEWGDTFHEIEDSKKDAETKLLRCEHNLCVCLI